MPVLPEEMVAEVFPGVGMLGGRLAAASAREYVRDVQHYLAYCSYDSARALDPQALRAWREHMVQRGLAASTINRRLAAVKTLVRVSAGLDALDAALAYRFHLVERVRPSTLRHLLRSHAGVRLEPEQLRTLWRLPDPTTLLGVRDRAFLATLASSGCRISEVVSLTCAQILPRQGSPTEEKRWQLEVWGKGQSKPRYTPLSHEAYRWIHLWLRARLLAGVEVPHIFTGFVPRMRPGTRMLTPNGGWRLVKRYACAAGLPQVKPHDYRRFVATQLAKRDLLLAQKVLGHARLETTRGYILDGDVPLGSEADVWM